MKKPTKKLNILRLLAVFTVCSILICSGILSVSAVESGACGEGISWELNAGTLIITGKGPMKDFKDSELAPWYEFRGQIVRVQIADTVTSIGDLAFYGCKNLVSVHIPNSVKTIGKYAFASCEKLELVQMGGAVSSIADGAFYNCYALESIRLPYGLSNLGSQAFYRCESLRTITVPSDVRTMGHSVFAYCKSLVRAEVKARVEELPEWTFYGCEQLSEVSLSETIKSIGNFGFKKCDLLSNVYYPGTEKNAKVLKQQISKDVSSFAFTGYITEDEIPSSSASGSFVEQEDDMVVNTDTVVIPSDQLIMSYTVERTYRLFSSNMGTYVANIVLTIEDNKVWDLAGDEVIKALSYISNTYSQIANNEKTTVTVYLENDVRVSQKFLNRLAGRDVGLTMVLANGSSWTLNCRNLKVVEVPDNDAGKNYSHTVKEATDEVIEKLGTEDCFTLVFEESTTQKAEVVVQLPTDTSVHSNAYLYQVEEDGSYTKLQAVAVDNNGRAHFYLASVDEATDYIVALDVPGESNEDVIIPDDLMPPSSSSSGSSALERLEDVKYVETGRVYSMGFGYGGLTWILIGVLVATTVLVGGIMMIWQKSKKTRIPVFEEQNAD